MIRLHRLRNLVVAVRSSAPALLQPAPHGYVASRGLQPLSTRIRDVHDACDISAVSSLYCTCNAHSFFKEAITIGC
jgi:hypothetical protein